MRGFRARYGAHPAHLLGVALVLLVAAAALVHLLRSGPATNVLLWLLGAIVVHDVILFPLYAALDRVATHMLRATPISALNHLRIPSVLSAMLLLVYFPLILGLSDRRYHASTGLTSGPYLARWLLITAALFAASALLYAARLRRASHS